MMALLPHIQGSPPRTPGTDVTFTHDCILIEATVDLDPTLAPVDQFNVHSADVVSLNTMCIWYLMASHGDPDAWGKLMDQDPPAEGSDGVGVIYVFVLLNIPSANDEFLIQARIIQVCRRDLEEIGALPYDSEWGMKLSLTMKLNARTYRDQDGFLVAKRPVRGPLDWVYRGS